MGRHVALACDSSGDQGIAVVAKEINGGGGLLLQTAFKLYDFRDPLLKLNVRNAG